MRYHFVIAALVTAFGAEAQAQPFARQWLFSRDGRVSLGVRGGGTMWFNDFDTHRLAGGADAVVRYGIARQFSVGLVASYVALQAQQQVLYPGTTLQFDYIETKGFALDLIGWYHFDAERRFLPYLYGGIGGYLYTRRVSGAVPYPDSRSTLSVHIPLGFGTELMFSRTVGLNVDFGVRIMDDNTDFWTGEPQGGSSRGLFDSYATGKVGLSIFFGSSDSDDDDNDGLTNGNERTLGLDPERTDSDGDGLSDGMELNTFRTDPKDADSDRDTLHDGKEISVYRTSPFNPDTDGDGLPDGDEVSKHGTNPLKHDTDGDGLSDQEEVLNYRTDPLKPDTDDDGWSDTDEVKVYRTNPLHPENNSAPNDSAQENTNPPRRSDVYNEEAKPSPPLNVGEVLMVGGIEFAPGRTTILPSAASALRRALRLLRGHPEIEVEIRGHTDNIGSEAANRQLSLRRAEAVRDWLILNGIVPHRLTVKGYGASRPIASNATPEDRAKNRRIEFVRTK